MLVFLCWGSYTYILRWVIVKIGMPNLSASRKSCPDLPILIEAKKEYAALK